MRAKIKNDSTTTPRGISKCPSRRNCHTCQHIQDRTRTVTFHKTNKTFDIRQSLDCNSTNLIYLLQCKRCLRNKKTDCQYIGQTGRGIRDKLNEHRRDIINRRSDTSGVAEHFCKPGHSVQDLQLLSNYYRYSRYMTPDRVLDELRKHTSLAWPTLCHLTD